MSISSEETSRRPSSPKLGARAFISPITSVGSNVTIGDDCVLHAGTVLCEDVHIGNGSILHPNVVIYPGVRIGSRCELHSGCVIGSDGYNYEHDAATNGYRKPVSSGGVVIGDDVEIGANSSIHRGQDRDTVVEDHVKIGDLTHVGHDCHIGRASRLIAQVGIASNVVLGERVILMGKVGVRAGVTIGDDAVVLAKSGVFGNLAGDRVYLGYPARPHREALKAMAALQKVHSLIRLLRRRRL